MFLLGSCIAHTSSFLGFFIGFDLKNHKVLSFELIFVDFFLLLLRAGKEWVREGKNEGA
jgi:hypothetical protein